MSEFQPFLVPKEYCERCGNELEQEYSKAPPLVPVCPDCLGKVAARPRVRYKPLPPSKSEMLRDAQPIQLGRIDGE